jgi:hypothetical protein
MRRKRNSRGERDEKGGNEEDGKQNVGGGMDGEKRRKDG